jgi:hypothetical protein
MFNRLKSAVRRHRDLHIIEALSPRELDDIGLSRPALRAVVSADDQVIGRQQEMATRHGLTVDMLQDHRPDLAQAIGRCADCGATGQCARYLASDAPASDSASFCPNHDLYDRLAKA